MPEKLLSLFICIIAACLTLAGCSGRDISTAPGVLLFDSSGLMQVGVSDFDTNGKPLAGYGSLGLFEIHVDVGTLEGEITPFRTTALTDVLEIVDIANFLQAAPCTDCVKLRSISLDADENLVLSIGIKHPFDSGDSGADISGRNRADLHVFNVEGTILASIAHVEIFGGLNQGVGSFTLANADGLSSYLNIPLLPFTLNTIHPYKLHFDDYTSGNFSANNPMGFQSVTNPPPSGNLVMAMGCDYDFQDYVLNIPPGEDIGFIYAVGCTYAVSAASRDDRFKPEYRIPQHLKKAAAKVAVRIVDNQLEPGNISSYAELEIDVVDMNHGVAVGDAIDEMFADSSVESIKLEIPGITTNVVDVALANIGGTGHSDSDPLIYAVTIHNEAAGVEGIYTGLVKVRDSYSPGSNILPLLDSMDGIQRVAPIKSPLEGLFPISEFATYQKFQIEIGGIVNEMPVADLQSEPDPAEIEEGYSVSFNATASSDTDGIITLYEFDFVLLDDELTNFEADVSNTTGITISDPYMTHGNYTAALRVTDDNVPGAVDYAVVQVTVNEWAGCPDAPYAGNTFNGAFTFSAYHDHYDSTNWENLADQIIDADILSSGNGAAIYADWLYYDGEMRIFDPDSTTFTPVGDDYPGAIGVSIDVDSTDLVVFVTSTLSHVSNDAEDVPLVNRIAASNDYFTVVDPFEGESSEQNVNVGTTIQAIDIDAYDDVWVLDKDNVMHRYAKATGYAESMARQFDLDSVTSGAFTGFVFDFVINFHNEAFYILTNATGKGVLWRFECDGTYNQFISGNPNPFIDVLEHATENDVADIGIDNLNIGGSVLDGAQDSQIVVVGGYFSTYWYSMISRIDSELGQHAASTINFGDGLTNVFFNQRTNTLWGWQSNALSDSFTEEWNPPSDWE